MKEIKVKCLGCGSFQGGLFCGDCHTVLPLEVEHVDFFRLFGMEPRPAVDLDALKATFFRLSQTLHPDRNVNVEGGVKNGVLSVSAQLNQGYNTLSHTKDRLRYLAGYETREEPHEANSVPTEIMELFFEAHELVQEVDAYLKQRKPLENRLMAALDATDERRPRFLETIARLQREVAGRVRRVEDEVKALDARWMNGEDRAGLLTRLNRLADVLAYLERLGVSLEQKELALRA